MQILIKFSGGKRKVSVMNECVNFPELIIATVYFITVSYHIPVSVI